jgi:hypothetical protein
VQLFEDRDYTTSKVFVEVFEGFIDDSFTKTAQFVHCNLGLGLGVSQKPLRFECIKLAPDPFTLPPSNRRCGDAFMR